jgi:WD40 repeat protein
MLKVWDWETGELERTLKGHTMAIKDCEFDSKGMKLGAFSLSLSSSSSSLSLLATEGPPLTHTHKQYQAAKIHSSNSGT